MQMIKYISAFILLIVSLTALSQPELTYQKVIGGTSNDIATEILQISDNQYVVWGTPALQTLTWLSTTDCLTC